MNITENRTSEIIPYAPFRQAKALLNNPLVQNLNLVQFVLWLGFIGKNLEGPLLSLRSSLKMQKKLYSLFSSKIERQDRHACLITRLGSLKDNLPPLYRIKPIQEMEGMEEERGIFYLPSVYQEMKAREGISLKTAADADKILAFMHQTPLIPWTVIKEGCAQRADVAGQIIRHYDLDLSKLFKIYAFGSFQFEFKDKYIFWGSHVALAVELEDGEVRVLDPSISPISQTVDGWISHFQPEYDPKTMRVTGEENPSFRMPEDTVTVLREGLDSYHTGEDTTMALMDRDRRFKTMGQLLPFKIREMTLRNPVLQACLAPALPVLYNDFNYKQTREFIIFEQLERRLSNFLEKPEASPLLFSQSINAIDVQYLKGRYRAESIRSCIKNLSIYKKHVESLSLKEKSKKDLIDTIDLKIGELRSA